MGALALAMDRHLLHMETSARTGDNVDNLFEAIARKLFDVRAYVLSLEVPENCGSTPELTAIHARNLAGEVVATVEADLLEDTLGWLKGRLAGQCGVREEQLALTFGTQTWHAFSENTKLRACLESSGWRGQHSSERERQ